MYEWAKIYQWRKILEIHLTNEYLYLTFGINELAIRSHLKNVAYLKIAFNAVNASINDTWQSFRDFHKMTNISFTRSTWNNQRAPHYRLKCTKLKLQDDESIDGKVWMCWHLFAPNHQAFKVNDHIFVVIIEKAFEHFNSHWQCKRRMKNTVIIMCLDGVAI